MKKHIILITAVAVLLFLPACTLGDGIPFQAESAQEAESGPLASLTPEQAVATATQVVATLAANPNPVAETPLPTPVDDPLRLVFPAAEPPPVSIWRPALYPTPWEPTAMDHFYFSRPIAANEVNWPLDEYRYGGVFFENVVHTGVDIPAPPGTPVLAAGDGKVVWSGYGLYRGVYGDTSDPYGQAVVIQHDFGYRGKQLFTVYGHLHEIFVRRGTTVKTGDELGLVGSTGKVTGPHLHLEVRWGEMNFFYTLNPELWLVPPQGWGILVMQVKRTNGKTAYYHPMKIISINTGQEWRAYSYADGAVNLDLYYQENLVVGDLPAGRYEIQTSYSGKLYTLEFDINPGRVSFLSFQGKNGFGTNPPPLPGARFDPSDLDPTATPTLEN